jgi:hypothetical protein
MEKNKMKILSYFYWFLNWPLIEEYMALRTQYELRIYIKLRMLFIKLYAYFIYVIVKRFPK